MSETLNILNKFGADRVYAIQESLADNRINASGRLSESVGYETKQKGFTFTLEISALSYIFSALQEGTSPEDAKKDPIRLRKGIDQWIDEKPVRFNKNEIDAGQLNFLITRKIINEGTIKWREYGSKGRTTGELEAIFSEEELNKIGEELIEQSLTRAADSFTKFSVIE